MMRKERVSVVISAERNKGSKKETVLKTLVSLPQSLSNLCPKWKINSPIQARDKSYATRSVQRKIIGHLVRNRPDVLIFFEDKIE